jgi:hypothetical protein
MDSADFTTEQARQLHKQLRPWLDYLNASLRRMGEMEFPPDDKIRRLTQATADSLMRLMIELEFVASHPRLPTMKPPPPAPPEAAQAKHQEDGFRRGVVF